MTVQPILLLAALVLHPGPAAGADGPPVGAPGAWDVEPTAVPAEAAHPRRLSQTRIDVSGPVATAHVRVFPDDLEAALRRSGGGETYRLRTGAGDAVLREYLSARLVLEADGDALEPGAVEVEDEGEMWHITVPFEALARIRTLVFRNELLVEAFPEQRNIVRIVHAGSGTDLTWTFSRRRETHRVRFVAAG